MTKEEAIAVFECLATEITAILAGIPKSEAAAGQIKRYIDAYDIAISALRIQQKQESECANCSGIVYRQTDSGKIIPVDQLQKDEPQPVQQHQDAGGGNENTHPPDGGFPFFLVHGFSFRRGVRYTTPLSILNSSWMRRTTPNRGKQTGTESAAVGSTNHSQRPAAPL